MTKPVVTRFAPSPTGYLHIGGARTALFNWLYARHTGGKFLLRIEDTDRERSTEAATKAILDGAVLARARLGRPDRVPVAPQRAARRGRPRAAGARQGLQLLPDAGRARGDAGRDHRRARAGAQREAATARSTDDPEPVARPRSQGGAGRRQARRSASRRRARARRSSTTRCRAASSSQNTQLDDLIILRSDGTPTYNLAVVVDDHDMGVTHVIRGADHLEQCQPADADLSRRWAGTCRCSRTCR